MELVFELSEAALALKDLAEVEKGEEVLFEF